jgi:hypothetical protein
MLIGNGKKKSKALVVVVVVVVVVPEKHVASSLWQSEVHELEGY